MQRWLSVEDLLRRLPALPTGGRRIELVILHHTWQPDHSGWRGDRTAEAIRLYWLRRQAELHWRQPPGGHFLVSPEGLVYAPFPLSRPLSANSSADANRRGVAIEVVGNFDEGHDDLTGRQRHAVMGLIGGLLVAYGLTPWQLMFHRDYTDQKTCPGTGLQRNGMREEAVTAMRWARGLVGAGPK